MRDGIKGKVWYDGLSKEEYLTEVHKCILKRETLITSSLEAHRLFSLLI
jgi:hypothetical protein